MAIKNIFTSKIKTKSLYFQLADEESTDLLIQSLDYLPYIFISKLYDDENHPNDPEKTPIDGTSVDPRDIIYVKLHNSNFLPEIELYCDDDSKGILFNDLYPYDHDTKISIFIKSSSENLMPIRMDFRLTEHETIKVDENKDTFRFLLKGILDVDALHFSRYEVGKGTSYEVLKQISSDVGLGFSTNTQDSNDDMTWINPKNTTIDFIKNITKHSFISDESFIWTFIDFNYNLNYIDINQELDDMNVNEEAPKWTNNQLSKNTEETNVLHYLTNNSAFKMTNHYINKFNITNQSFKVNLEKSYKMKASWYNSSENKVYKKNIKELETNISTSQQNKSNFIKHLYDKNSWLYWHNTNDKKFFGKLDTDNVHEDYFLAKTINEYNLENLEKMKMIITLNQLNFSIKRFQTLRVEIYNPQDLLSTEAHTRTPLDNINKKLSGFWFVTGINYLYKRSGGVEQEIVLMRRDLNLTYGQGTDKHDLRYATSEQKA